MTRIPTCILIRTWLKACQVSSAILLLAGLGYSQPAISVSRASGPPTTSLRISGSGFAPNSDIDVYFDTQDQAFAKADGWGSFSQITIQAPASALSGTHWVSAVDGRGQTGAQVQFTVQADWNEFHRRNMLRYNPYENVLNIGNAGKLRVKWHYSQGWPIASAPAVAAGTLYIASYKGVVYAFKLSTGAMLWSYSFNNNGVSSSPAVWNGMVYIGGGPDYLERPGVHTVNAFNASTGALVWSYTTGADVLSSPIVSNGVVYIGSEDNNVYALNASTGALLWSYATGGQVNSSPALSNGVIYVGSDDDNVYALNAGTGAKLWSYTTGNAVNSSPALANGVVYVGSMDNKVYALNAGTGALVWSYATGAGVDSSPAVTNGVVYVGSEDDNVYALNASAGTLIWSHTTGNGVASSPAVANGVVYVNSSDGYAYALNAGTGGKLWQYHMYGTGPVNPAVVNGVLYTASGYGQVLAFSLKGKADEDDDAASRPPDLKLLHPDANLKASQPVAALSGAAR